MPLVYLSLLFLACGPASGDEEYTMGVGSGTSTGVGLAETGGEVSEDSDAGLDAYDGGEHMVQPSGSGAPDEISPDASCSEIAASWPTEWIDFEDLVLAITNEYRAQSVDCRSAGLFPPALPLQDDPLLRCAARRHSLDMIQRGYFAHVSPDGVPPSDRVVDAGYSFRAVGENIAAGQMTPQAVVDGWIASDGHCANLMNPAFEELGTGYVNAPTNLVHYWTQVFGTPN